MEYTVESEKGLKLEFKMEIKASGIGVPKSGRDSSEDAFHLDPDNRFFIVADGLGELGHKESEEAIRMLTVQIDYALRDDYSIKQMENSMREAIKEIHSYHGDETLRFLRENPGDVKYFTGRHPKEIGGTTLEALVHLESDRQFLLVHVGDSKTIGITEDGDYKEISQEHAPWKRRALEQGLSEEEQFTSDDRYRIDNFLGKGKVGMTQEEVTFSLDDIIIDFEVFPENQYQYILIATDGVFDYATQREIREIVTTAPLENVTQRLIERAHNPLEVLEIYHRKYKDCKDYSREELEDELVARDDATAIIIKPELVKEYAKPEEPRKPYEGRVPSMRKLSLDWDLITRKEEGRQLIISRFFDGLMDSYGSVSGEKGDALLDQEHYRGIFDDNEFHRGVAVLEYAYDLFLGLDQLCIKLNEAGIGNVRDYLDNLPEVTPLPGAKTTEELRVYLKKSQEIYDITSKKIQQGLDLFSSKVGEASQLVGEQQDADAYHNALKQVSELEKSGKTFRTLFSTYGDDTEAFQNTLDGLQDHKLAYLSKYVGCHGIQLNFTRKQPNDRRTQIPTKKDQDYLTNPDQPNRAGDLESITRSSAGGPVKRRDLDDPVVMEPEEVMRPDYGKKQMTEGPHSVRDQIPAETKPLVAEGATSYERADALFDKRDYTGAIDGYRLLIAQEQRVGIEDPMKWALAIDKYAYACRELRSPELIREAQGICESALRLVESDAPDNQGVLAILYLNMAANFGSEGRSLMEQGANQAAIEKYKPAFGYAQQSVQMSDGAQMEIAKQLLGKIAGRISDIQNQQS